MEGSCIEPPPPYPQVNEHASALEQGTEAPLSSLELLTVQQLKAVKLLLCPAAAPPLPLSPPSQATTIHSHRCTALSQCVFSFSPSFCGTLALDELFKRKSAQGLLSPAGLQHRGEAGERKRTQRRGVTQ